jgi:hypothetical protein
LAKSSVNSETWAAHAVGNRSHPGGVRPAVLVIPLSRFLTAAFVVPVAVHSRNFVMKRFARAGLLFGLLAAGCGKESEIPKAVVTGTVTYNKENIEMGQIRFMPIEGTKGPMAAGIIIDGKYEATAAGGVPLGKHKVEIEGYIERTDLRKADVPFAPTPREQYVPDKYNKNSELSITVEANREEPLNFDLEGPPRKTPPKS